MSRSISLAGYLFSRLKQQGVNAVHGVPGDFTLKSLDHLKTSGLKWVGCCNELNAGYAADGYARVKGLSALSTTYGVGELSAINAVAGSYAEDVPVVHIVGTPQWHVQQSGAKVHHTLGDGRFRVFAEAHKNFVAAQTNLIDITKAPEQIDETLETCLTTSKPVYVELPCDMVAREVSTERLEHYKLRTHRASSSQVEAEQAKYILSKIYAARQPLILVDRGLGIEHCLKQEINDFVGASGIPTLTLPSGNGMVDHSFANYFGVNEGSVGQINTLPYLDAADFVISFGPQGSDTQTLGWRVLPPQDKTITIGNTFVIAGKEMKQTSVDTRALMRKIISQVDRQLIAKPDTASLGNFRKVEPPTLSASNVDDSIDQSTLYLRLQPMIRKNDIIFLGNATPILGGRCFVLPHGAQVIASGMWFSIGSMLPCALGAAIAQQADYPERRVILIDGDGNVQVSVQEISTIIRHRLNITIFIINNGGYAYERQIHGMYETYNDLALWRYLEAPKLFGAADLDDYYQINTWQLRTWRDLTALLHEDSFNNGRGLKLVEVIVDKFDVPEKFKTVFHAAGKRL